MSLVLLFLLTISIVVNIFFVISIKKAFSQIDSLEIWLIDFKNLMNQTYNKLKIIDNRDIFEKDDEVGVAFKEILSIIDSTNNIIKDDDDDPKEKR